MADTVKMQATTGRELSRQSRAICHSGPASATLRHRSGFLAALALALLFVLVPARPALAVGFADATSSPYYVQIQTLSQLGVISGFSDGTFRPVDPVTRQQFAKMVVLTMRVAVSESDVCPFGDVLDSGPDSLFPDNYVAAAYRAGITTGTRAASGAVKALFSPDANIPLAQLVTMVTRAAGRPLTEPPSSYRSTWGGFDAVHAPKARLAEYNKLLREFNLASMNPWRNATRAEAAAILFNLLGTDGESIAGNFLGTTGDLVKYFRTHVPSGEEFSIPLADLARLYDRYARRFGIRADVAWVQMCHETGFGRYGGDVKPEQNNFAGIGATGGVPGNSFATAELGVVAQIAHLAWYAYPEHFDDPYCRMVTVADPSVVITEPGDPRHFVWQGAPHRAGARTLADLSTKWAAGAEYGAALKEMVAEVPLTKGF